MRRFGLLALAVLALLGGGDALAATAPAGTAVGVDPSAVDGSRTLVVGSDVGMGDRIVTGPSGQVQLIFNEGTHLVVGPSSSLVVQSYLLRSDQSVGQFAVNALSGSFRFITGKADHSAYSIATPTGTIGVRGTSLDFLIDNTHPVLPKLPPGTLVSLFTGAVQLCDKAGKCVLLSHSCDIGGMSATDAYTLGHGEAADAGARARFIYIASERPLMSAFRVKQSRLCYLNTSSSNSTLATPLSGGRGCTVSRGGGGCPR